MRLGLCVLAAASYLMPWTPVTERWGWSAGERPVEELVVGLELLLSPEGSECFPAWMLTVPILVLGFDSVRRFCHRVLRGWDRVGGAETVLSLAPRIGLVVGALLLGGECLMSLARSEPWGVGAYLCAGSGLTLVLVDVIYVPASLVLAYMWSDPSASGECDWRAPYGAASRLTWRSAVMRR